MFFSSIKEINRLIRKTDVLKTTIFSEGKFEEISEEQNSTSYIRGKVYFGIIVFSCLSSTKSFLRFLLICFNREIKYFYQNSLGNDIDFRDIMNVSLNA